MKGFISRGFLVGLAVALMSMVAAPAFAQETRAQEDTHERPARHAHKHKGAMKGDRVLMKELVPPRMALRFQEEIGLTDAQRTQLEMINGESRATAVSLREDLKREVTALREILAQPTVNEAAALAQLDRVTAAESQVKRARFQSMIRTKNLLSEDQIEQLGELRKEHRGERGEKRKKRRHQR
ncbi:MAG: Spy/CpxP family protein refolding chaperone [Bradymonadaceae bacterium]